MGKIVKLKNKKTGVRVYPVTATSAVVDANSGERLNDTLQNKVEEAPMDGNQYVRINGTWGVAQMATSTKEKCTISLVSNQGESDAASIYGATVKVTDVDSQEVYYNGVWNGTEIFLELAPGVNYKIEVGAVADYTTPESKTLTALELNVRNMVFTYNTELVSVTLSADNGESMSGQKVTINGVEHTWNGNAITQKVAFGVKYSVSVDSRDEYIAPSSQDFTSGQIYRSLSFVYIYSPGITNPGNGVWIKSVEGRFYTAEKWDESKVADCVAVITDSCRFGIALTQRGGFTIDSNPSAKLEEYMTAIPDITQAKADYDGATNTANILKIQSGTKYAAGYCNAYTFPSGKKGYLPAAGQLWAVFNNKSAVFEAIGKAGGDGSIYLCYWSSTFGEVGSDGVRRCWQIMFDDYGNMSYQGVHTSNSVLIACEI